MVGFNSPGKECRWLITQNGERGKRSGFSDRVTKNDFESWPLGRFRTVERSVVHGTAFVASGAGSLRASSSVPSGVETGLVDPRKGFKHINFESEDLV